MRRFLAAVSFLTIIPAGPGGKIDGSLPSRSLAFFSIVGTLFGGVLAAAAWGLLRFLPPLPAAAVVVVAWAALSRALHLDGLADTFDALGGSRDRKRRLEIMKDSRIGTFGAVAVCLCLVLKTALIAELAAGGAASARLPFGALASALVLSPVMGRTVMALAVSVFPAARKTGLGGAFKAHCRAGDAVVCASIAVAAAVLMRGMWGPAFSAGIAAAGLGCGALFSRAFGGLTGDSYGALCEISEAAGLLVLIVLPAGGMPS